MNGVRRFLALSPLRRRLLLETVALVLVCRLGLALASVGTTARLLGPAVPVLSRLHPRSSASLADLTWAVETAETLAGGTGTCLEAALVGDRLLDAHGYDSTLRIGVAKDERGTFEAHAWLERDDRVVVGDLADLSRFQPLPIETVDRLADNR